MKALFFDIFGTLVDWRSSIMEGLKELEFFKKKNSEQLEELVINWRKEYQPIINKVNNNTLPWQTLDELHNRTLEKVLKKMGFDKMKETDKKYLVLLWHQIRPWKDSCAAINKLNKNYITASLSNGNILLQKNLLKYANLNFDFIFSAEHFKKYKPNKLVYMGAIDMLNLKVSQCALVASHKNDLYAASKIGMRTIYIRREKEYGNYGSFFKEKNFQADLELSSLKNITYSIKKIKF